MKKIIYMQNNGIAAVVIPAAGARLVKKAFINDIEVTFRIPRLLESIKGNVTEWAETEDEFVQRIANKNVPKELPHAIVEENTIPTDRTFRNAWEISGNLIIHNMDKCKTIHKDKLRMLRQPKLEALDIEYQQADEQDNKEKKQAIAAKKQALRDVTKDSRIESATTPEELKLILPDILV